MGRPRVLLLDHPSPSLRALSRTLESEGFAVLQTEASDEALATVRSGGCEVVLGEITLAAEALLAEVRGLSEAPPVIVFDDFAGFGGDSNALAQGAFDALARPLPDEEVLRAVRRALESHTLRIENARLRGALGGQHDFGALSSSDPQMRRIFETLTSVADSHVTLLFTGESGTGKTQLAHAVHQRSARARGAFVEVNCGALPAALLESELFGHVRGAFTGAVRDRAGKFEQAQGGTLLLDEIGTASAELQVKLLRVLEEGRYERVGDTRTRTSDARVIAATNVDLEREVAAGRFRADLFYRIHVVPVRVPALRERVGDIPLLARRFAGSFATRHGREARELSPPALQALCSHLWPGNVRELENTIERAVLVAAGRTLEPADLWPAAGPVGSPAAPPAPGGAGSGGAGLAFEGWGSVPPDDLKAALEAPERWLIRRALEREGGSRTRAAERLGINRTTLFNKMRKYALLSSPRQGA